MLRFVTLVSIATTFLTAFVLYATNYQTRALEHELEAAQRRLDALSREVATLRAERAFLARPSRISKAARALGMRPAAGAQYRTSTPRNRESGPEVPDEPR